MISSPSSVLRPRVLVSRFKVRHSGPSGLPMPKAGNRRPSDRKSIVAHCLATSTGSRKASESTLTPNLSRRVRPARAAIRLMHSRIGSRLIMRSVCHSESTPPASQRSTQRQNPDTPSNGNSISPSPIATFLGILASLVDPLRLAALRFGAHRHIGEVLRRLGAVEHAVVADHPDTPMANISDGQTRPSRGCCRITPRGQQDIFALLVDAGEDVPV